MKEFAGVNRIRNSDDVLGNGTPCAKVQMADFAVAHLAFGQANRSTGSLEQCLGSSSPYTIPGRSAAKSDRVAVGLGAVAPSVQDDQDDGPLWRKAIY